MQLTIEQALQKAVEAHNSGNLEYAEKLYRAILQIQPKNSDANHNLGVLAVYLNKTKDALPLFKIALEVNPSQGQFWLSYIDALIKEKKFVNAKNLIEQGKKFGLVGEKIDSLEAKLCLSLKDSESIKENKAPTFIQQHKNVHAKTEKKKSSPLNKINLNQARSPSQQDAKNLLEYYQKGHHDLAQNFAIVLTQQYPLHPLGWKVLGTLLKRVGKLSDSLIAYQKVLEITPKDVDTFSNLGITLHELGRLEEAEECYRKAIAIKPEFAQAYYNLGNTLQELGRLEEAWTSYKRAIAIKPDYAQAHSNLGNTLKELGILEDAVKSYIKAIAIKPDYVQAHYNLGITLKELGKLEEAEESYGKAIAIKPDYAQAHNNLGITLQELGKLEEAEESYRKAIVIKPDYADAHNNLGSTLTELGMLEDAEKSYKRAISIKPDYVEATLNIAMLSIRQNEIADSIKYLEKVIEISTDDFSLMAIVKLAVLNFQAYDLNSSKLLIEKSKKILQRESSLVKHDLNYHIYLSKLISWHMINSAPIDNYKGQWIHVIGESHALASNRLFIKNFNNGAMCEVYWINGCKQWHLGKSKSNQYKQQFERLMNYLPNNSSILFAIGEIDCRIDDGIIKHYKKYPSQNLKKIIESTINDFLIYIHAKTSVKSMHVVIQGVSCPNIDSSNIEKNDLLMLVNLIKKFNFVLERQSKKFGFGFLDLHTLTDRGDGYSNGIWNIDNYHLSPAGMLEAWRLHYKSMSPAPKHSSIPPITG